MSNDHKPNLIGSYWKVIVIFRWTLTLLIIVFAREYFALQIISLLSLSILNQSLLLGSKPLVERSDQSMSVINEIANSVYIYMLILLTDFMGDTGIREQIGWSLMILIGGVVFINLMKVLSKIPSAYKKLIRKIKDRCSKK